MFWKYQNYFNWPEWNQIIGQAWDFMMGSKSDQMRLRLNCVASSVILCKCKAGFVVISISQEVQIVIIDYLYFQQHCRLDSLLQDTASLNQLKEDVLQLHALLLSPETESSSASKTVKKRFSLKQLVTKLKMADTGLSIAKHFFYLIQFCMWASPNWARLTQDSTSVVWADLCLRSHKRSLRSLSEMVSFYWMTSKYSFIWRSEFSLFIFKSAGSISSSLCLHCSQLQPLQNQPGLSDLLQLQSHQPPHQQ